MNNYDHPYPISILYISFLNTKKHKINLKKFKYFIDIELLHIILMFYNIHMIINF